MTLAEQYNERLAVKSDIQAHLAPLAALARECRHVTEFGVRHGLSTTALLYGLVQRQAPGELVSYDLRPCIYERPELPGHVAWHFVQHDTASIQQIAETDLLFIDSLHTSAHVTAELRHARSVRRWIAFHDTITFGTRGDRVDGIHQPGITHAIYRFLAEESAAWRVLSHTTECNGLLILERIAR